MPSQFKLMTQLPKPKQMGAGVLSIDKKGDATFFANNGDHGDSILALMERTRIESATSHGIMLSGMQPAGTEKNGLPKFTYQEWWLRYINIESIGK